MSMYQQQNIQLAQIVAAQQQMFNNQLNPLGGGSGMMTNPGPLYFSQTASTPTSAATSMYWVNQGTGGTTNWTAYNQPSVIVQLRDCVRDGEEVQIKLPDNTIIDVKKDGSYSIEDKDAKVIYRASRIHDFNRFMNVSDRMEEFIDFCAKQGVEKNEFMNLPIKLFIGWLILEAAKADKEPPPQDIRLLPDLRKQLRPQCPGCGKFLPRFAIEYRVPFCAPPCFERHYTRMIPHAV